MTIAIILFVATYAMLLILPKYRHWVALASAFLFIVLGYLPVSGIADAIDWNVLMMIAGTMGLVSLFIESGMPALLSDITVEKTPNVKWAIVAMCLFAGVVSAFVDNVATVLMVAPVAVMITKRFKIDPVPVIIAISVSSNLQGAATLVGDTTSILLGSYAGLDFLDFFWVQGRPGMFFVTEIGALLTIFVLLWLFRKQSQKIETGDRTEVKDLVPTWLLGGAVIILILASFLPEKPSITNGLICMCFFVIGLVYRVIKKKSLCALADPIREIDWQTLLLLGGLFLVIAGVSNAGVIDAVAQIFMKIGGDSIIVVYSLVVWGSVIFSAFIDNIPYVSTMLPVMQSLSAMMGTHPYLLYFGLLTGATLGGNLTPVGASANITGIGILRKEGHEVKTGDFLRIGVPFTLTAVIAGYLIVWFLWANVV